MKKRNTVRDVRALMEKDYLFTRFADEAEYYHFICYRCGYDDKELYDNEI